MSDQEDFLTIHVATNNRQPELLQGIESWLDLGLISDGQLKINIEAIDETPQSNSRMAVTLPIAAGDFLEGLYLWLERGFLNQARIQFVATVPTFHPALLIGLDEWLQAGLMSDLEVKRLCQEQLACSVLLATAPSLTEASRALVLEESVAIKRPVSIGRLAQILHSLMAELSVLWLLLLGMFMVVVSSGVLAASLWERFPAAGQYGILWFYTLAFGAAGFWASRRPNLQLTTQALWATTLLLLPVNFLAIDSFRLWQSGMGWLVAAIAALSLTALTGWIFHARSPAQQNGFHLSRPLLNYLGLSALHWGWVIPGWPLMAAYLGVIGTTVLTLSPEHRNSSRSAQQPTFNLYGVLIVYAIALLLLRAILTRQVELPQLGLAIGLSGWLVTQAANRDGNRSWEGLGAGLLGLGWLLSVITLPWQALVVSGLGIWVLRQRLVRNWFRLELTAILLIGLQMLWLGWRLLPDTVQQNLITTATRLTGAEQTPLALLSVVLLPYLVLMLAIADGLIRLRQKSLATFAGWAALLFGTCLTVLSLVNPLLRSVNLVASALSWAILAHRQQQRNLGEREECKIPNPSLRFLANFCHTLALVALASAIDWQRPPLGLVPWAGILLGLTLLEWIFTLPPIPDLEEPGRNLWDLLRENSWEFGVGLAGLSYGVLLLNQLANWINLTQVFDHPVAEPTWGAIWLITPIALTGLLAPLRPRRHLASQLSIAALGLAQLLTLGVANTRLLGLGIATGVMVVNTRRLRTSTAAVITVGFGLGLVVAGIAQGWSKLSLTQWLLIGAIATGLLWATSFWLSRQDQPLAPLYQKATDRWAIALCLGSLVGLTLHTLLVFWELLPASFVAIGAANLLVVAIAFRSWQQPSNLALYGMGWSLELVTLEVISFTGRSLVTLAIANIGLGLLTQLVGDWWHRRGGRHREMLNGWHVLPLLYGAVGAALRANVFSSWTGWSTLGLVLIGIGVGRRQAAFKPLLYLSVAGISVAAYELLAYQVAGQSPGDQYLAMATLATSLVYAYRILTPWLIPYLRLSREELHWIAHIHWALGSILLLVALFYPAEANKLVGLAAGLFLTCYAVMQGRRHPDLQMGEIWVYLGLLEAAGMITYASLTIPPLMALSRLLRPWSGALTAIAAVLLHQLPWQQWGWSPRPWRVAAVLAPLLAISLNLPPNPVSLLVIAGFYGWLARQQQPRCLYLSLGFVDWAIVDQLSQWHRLTPFIAATLVGFSILLIPLIEPTLRPINARGGRHLLRLLGSGIICGTALIWHHQTGILPGIVSLIAIFAGLALRTRAFLYVGTAAFLANVFYQLVILSFTYALIKWIVGLVIGVCFIWIAASFETRRGQLTTLVRSWLTELEEWE